MSVFWKGVLLHFCFSFQSQRLVADLGKIGRDSACFVDQGMKNCTFMRIFSKPETGARILIVCRTTAQKPPRHIVVQRQSSFLFLDNHGFLLWRSRESFFTVSNCFFRFIRKRTFLNAWCVWICALEMNHHLLTSISLLALRRSHEFTLIFLLALRRRHACTFIFYLGVFNARRRSVLTTLDGPQLWHGVHCRNAHSDQIDMICFDKETAPKVQLLFTSFVNDIFKS